MTSIRLLAVAALAGASGIGSALAQDVPARIQGEYAIGSCAAPDVSMTIDGAGITVFASDSGEVIASVEILYATEFGGRFEMDVVVDNEQFGVMTLSELGAGAIEVVFTEDGGSPETPVRLELCAAAEVSPPQPDPMPPVTAGLVPAELLGEFATGSCAAPDDRLVVGADQVEAFSGSGRSEGVAYVLNVAAIPGGYNLAVDLDGDLANLELVLINQDIVEAVFISPAGRRADPETLFRCTPLVVADDGPAIDDGPVTDDGPVIDDGPEMTGMTLPDAYLGLYAIGQEATCESGDKVEFEPDRLVIFEGDRRDMVIMVESILSTSPVLEFVISADGRRGAVTMVPTGGDRFRLDFTDLETGEQEDSEELILCEAAFPTGTMPPVSTADIGGFIFDEPAARFGAVVAELEAACVEGSEQACFDTFWAFADVTGDGQLTAPELARVIRYGAKWAVDQQLLSLALGQKLAVHLGTMVTAPMLANGLLYNHDYDGNNALSQVEMFPDGVESAPLAVPALMSAFSEQTLEDLFEALEEFDRML